LTGYAVDEAWYLRQNDAAALLKLNEAEKLQLTRLDPGAVLRLTKGVALK
jgi:hypothetical protein